MSNDLVGLSVSILIGCLVVFIGLVSIADAIRKRKP